MGRCQDQRRLVANRASGLIGSEAVAYFDRRGYEVVGIDNNMRQYFFGEDGSVDWNTRELKKQLEHEREQNLESTQRIKAMMEKGHPPSQPTPTAQADSEVIAELTHQLQHSKDRVQYLNGLVDVLGTKLAERDTRIAKQKDEIAKLDIDFEKLGTQVSQLKENKQEMEDILKLINANTKKTQENLTMLTMLQFCRDMADKK